MIKRVEKVTDKITLYNCDCMEYMKTLPDKAFDLAIVDPPYGIGFGAYNRTNRNSKGERFKANKYKQGDWDSSIPTVDYFMELKRVSRNQIVWGGNYFPHLWEYGCRCFVFWHKQNPVDNFADGELAWTSFDKVAKCFNYRYFGNIQGSSSADSKIHPTQKPVALYEWLLKNYAKPTDKILDTHFGSCSIGIACNNFGCELDACELDWEYFNNAVKRVRESIRQLDMFR